MKAKVLFVDDDTAFLQAIEFALADDFELTISDNFKDSLSLLEKKTFDLVALDYDLGTYSAEDLLDKVPSAVPVLIVTGKAEKDMAIRLLNKHVHGLIEKPVTSRMLQKKIQELLLSSSHSKGGQEYIAALEVSYHSEKRRVLIRDQEITLTPIESKLFDALLHHRNKKLQRSELIFLVWGHHNQSKNVLDTHIYNLKKKVPLLEKALKAVYGDGLYLEI